MMSTELRSLAEWWDRHSDKPHLLSAFDACAMSALFENLADQAEALERATLLPNARATAIPPGVADLAAARRARTPIASPQHGDPAA